MFRLSLLDTRLPSGPKRLRCSTSTDTECSLSAKILRQRRGPSRWNSLGSTWGLRQPETRYIGAALQTFPSLHVVQSVQSDVAEFAYFRFVVRTCTKAQCAPILGSSRSRNAFACDLFSDHELAVYLSILPQSSIAFAHFTHISVQHVGYPSRSTRSCLWTRHSVPSTTCALCTWYNGISPPNPVNRPYDRQPAGHPEAASFALQRNLAQSISACSIHIPHETWAVATEPMLASHYRSVRAPLGPTGECIHTFIARS
ncbi:hypothetical protein BV22DRAFT_37424 [Leucogyrophana mollusca]|uniref:Uncharacterized protein n=1 Tax=Leucogyrophana mollusca TaxID=85980 RepID=A0ACB8C1B7_9AGAM|nr:hypothetical protein BV22DRAFT_37424 [Leucogyrophana mollusca]